MESQVIENKTKNDLSSLFQNSGKDAYTDFQNNRLEFFDKTIFFNGDGHEATLPFKVEIIHDTNLSDN